MCEPKCRKLRQEAVTGFQIVLLQEGNRETGARVAAEAWTLGWDWGSIKQGRGNAEGSQAEGVLENKETRSSTKLMGTSQQQGWSQVEANCKHKWAVLREYTWLTEQEKSQQELEAWLTVLTESTIRRLCVCRAHIYAGLLMTDDNWWTDSWTLVSSPSAESDRKRGDRGESTTTGDRLSLKFFQCNWS